MLNLMPGGKEDQKGVVSQTGSHRWSRHSSKRKREQGLNTPNATCLTGRTSHLTLVVLSFFGLVVTMFQLPAAPQLTFDVRQLGTGSDSNLRPANLYQPNSSLVILRSLSSLASSTPLLKNSTFEDAVLSQPSAEPRIALLMSFPNSGTTYTLTNTQLATNMSVGTNYAQGANLRVPIHSKQPGGPFILDTTFASHPLVLTKTHCSIHNDFANFERECRTTKYSVNGSNFKSTYPIELVAKAVHLVRSPMDNVVARMHYGIRKSAVMHSRGIRKFKFRGRNLSKQKLATFTDDRAGFHKWCTFIDNKFGQFPNEVVPEAARHILPRVPCFSDFLHYIAWHNLAAEVIEHHKLPVHILFYEDYSTRYNETIRDLFAFLGLEKVSDPSPFMPGKRYDHFFDQYEIQAIKELIAIVASPQTRHLFHRYFHNQNSIADLQLIPNRSEKRTQHLLDPESMAT